MGTAGTYQMVATDTGGGTLAAATGNRFAVTSGAPVGLAFLQEPTNTAGGTPIAPAVSVRILDAWGNTTRTSAGVSLAIEENGGPGGILSGTTVVTAREGIATFPDVKIDKAGTDYTLEASARLSPSQTLQRTSAAFDITVGQPAKLVFSTPPPASARAGTLFRTVVEVRDAGVNRVPVDGKPISITLQAPAGGTLAGTTTVETTAGQAAFDLSIATPGTGYRLCADAEGMTQAISAPFNVTPGAPARLLFRSQPQDGVAGIALAPAINVVVADAAGNVMTSAAYTITLSLTGGDSPATVAALSYTKLTQPKK